MVFYAVRDIPAGAAAEISYLPLRTPTPERRRLLREWFFFDCACPRCAFELREPADAAAAAAAPPPPDARPAHLCRAPGCRGWMVPAVAISPAGGLDVLRSSAAVDGLALPDAAPDAWVCEACMTPAPLE
ncbi:hypothetical protein HK105_208913 [Polyrhizophydium stewartii]|uniref:Uncharacterized protein n=1 Tax=Polyrhizophydium stewartii TaxID=2732419 RepID=A0ABR4MWF7_9FUNG